MQRKRQSAVAALCGAQRGEEPGPGAQPPERELDRPDTRTIRPLEVVDREQHRRVLREPAQDRQHGGTNRAVVRDRGPNRGPQQHEVDRPPLRVRQRVQHLVIDVRQQVGH